MESYKIRNTLSKKSKINYIDKNTEELHITHIFSRKDILKILNRCKRLRNITLSRSSKDRLSDKTKELIKKNKVKLHIKKEQGRAIEISINKLNKILKMYKDFSYRELGEKLGVPKSTIHYLIKKSKRRKIKDGNKIIYLK